MLIETLLSVIITAILTIIARRLVGANRKFFMIIDDFRKKLPPRYKTAKSGFNKDFRIVHMNLKTLQSNIQRSDLDYFLKQLEDFDYSSIIFKRKQIKSYSTNLQRIIKTTSWDSFCIGLLQDLLEGEDYTKSKPYLFGLRFAKYFKF